MRAVGEWVGRILLAGAAVLLLVVGVGPLTGAYRLATVVTGSMAPGMPVGSLAVVVPVNPAVVQVGDVITFRAPTPDHEVVTHRVVEILAGGPHPVLRTKGDANTSADPWAVRLGGPQAWRRVAVAPWAGSAIRLLRSGTVHRLTVQVAPAMLLVLMLVAIWRPGAVGRGLMVARRWPRWPRPAFTQGFRFSRSRAVALGVAVMMAVAVPAAANFTTSGTASNTVATSADWLPPSVSSTVIAKQTGYLAGAIKQGGTYYVYANDADSGNPASGISTAKTDVSAVTTGSTAVPLVAGSYSVNGVSYNYRSAALTANGTLSGSKSYTITSTDTLAHAQTQSGYSVTIDNTKPTASNIATGNVSGGTHGKAETGDTITFTFSEQIDPESVLSGWNGASTNVIVELEDGGCGVLLCSDDTFTIFDSSYTNALPFGTIDLSGSGDYYGCAGLGLLCGKTPTNFGSTGTPSTMVQSGSAITITLGTRSGGNGSVNTASGSTQMKWPVSTTFYDAAGNSPTSTTFTESNTNVEF